jgi:hypothetical protein
MDHILSLLNFYVPIKSFCFFPRDSPLIVTLVPGGPSLGDRPVTTGCGAIVVCLNNNNHFLMEKSKNQQKK